MDSHNCGGILLPAIVMLKRSYQVDGFRCSHCGEEIVGRDTALSIEKLERERDELLAACEAFVAEWSQWEPEPTRVDKAYRMAERAIAQAKGDDDGN